MKLEAAVAFSQRRPFGLCLLHAVFPEHPLALSDHRLDGSGSKRLCDRHQRNGGGIAPGLYACARNLATHLGQGRFNDTRSGSHVQTGMRRAALCSRSIVKNDSKERSAQRANEATAKAEGYEG